MSKTEQRRKRASKEIEKNPKQKFDSDPDLKKVNKTKTLFRNLFRRRRKSQSNKKYIQFKYDERYITNETLVIEDEKQKLMKNHYVSIITKKNLMEIVSGSQSSFASLGFHWTYPNIFTLKASKNSMKIKIKIISCQIYKEKDPIEVRVI
eukprot:Anaeramoba_ignava/a614612_5.p1 GENE.a614612_5~~a614612_5.p1  ORF type:complete len:150 (-),score=53.10 a614612_5:19-468(-)